MPSKSATRIHPLSLILTESALTALAATLLSALALTAVCMATKDPGAYLTPLAHISLLPGALCAGITAAKRAAAKLGGLPAGIAAGVLFALLLFALGLLLPKAPQATAANPSSLSSDLIRAAAAVLVSAAAGYTVTHRKPRSHRPRRR